MDNQRQAESCYNIGMMSDEYIAGFVDGEGYLGIMKHSDKRSKHGYNYVPAIKIAQTLKDRKVLDLISQRFDYNIDPVRKGKGNHNDSVAISFRSAVKVAALLDAIEDKLIVKKEQAKILRQFIETKYKLPWNKKENVEYNSKMLEKRHQLYMSIRHLNQRGRRD